ncbi:hypothetical protein DITRI_Ditri09bG0142200 [Diplodiscus trichospermus]
MEAPMKSICALMFLVIMTISGFNGVDGSHGNYGPCGKHDIEKEAEKLAPCTEAAKYIKAPVSERCCTIMEKKLKNPSCLCAVLFSRTAYYAGVKPEVAVTIPKRCHIPVRPIGYKCGGRIHVLLKSALLLSVIFNSHEAICVVLAAFPFLLNLAAHMNLAEDKLNTVKFPN